ncbi:MAG: nucleotidyl transferase AbiEii/AbiGii toxin family protein [Bacteroidota bacterium]
MIILKTLKEAKKNLPWKYNYQIEQDLIISKVLVSMYNNPILRDTLVFRGGTALNKLFLHPPARFSEDLDFVQLRAGNIGSAIGAIRDSMKWFLEEAELKRPRVDIGKYGTKLFYKYQYRR